MSERPPKAEGMQWLNPYMVVQDVKRALDFYEKAFGFKTRVTMPDKEGNIMHAEMVYKDNVIMLGPESDDHKLKSVHSLKGSPVSFYLYVDNVDEFYQKAKEAGAEVNMEPQDQFWGDRICNFKCPEGYSWTFAQNVADFDPQKAPY